MSDLTKHTPGPWRINRRASMLVETESGRSIASCGGHSETKNAEQVENENIANALLIASAPDMKSRIERLEAALRDTLTILDHARVFISCREKMHQTGQQLYDENREAIRAILGEA